MFKDIYKGGFMIFSEWVLQELGSRGWSQSDLARASGLTRGTISNLLNEVASPNPQTCIQIAKAFELPPEVVLRKAGILPPRTKIDEDVDRLAYRIAPLHPLTAGSCNVCLQKVNQICHQRPKIWRLACFSGVFDSLHQNEKTDAKNACFFALA
jgi:transcriptional regulator with XRE-family HTH domain